MLSYIMGLLLLSKFGIPKPLRYGLLIFMAGLLIVVVIWTTNLFLTLDQRTSAPHVHTHSAR
jgi:hypothetical protein